MGIKISSIKNQYLCRVNKVGEVALDFKVDIEMITVNIHKIN